jgi:hypothetical protein
MIVIDPATGMPALPPTYFWRVTTSPPMGYDRWPTVSIQLRKRKNPFLWMQNRSSLVSSLSYACEDQDKKLWTADGYYYHPALTTEQTKKLVQNAATNIYRAHEQALQDNENERVLKATLETIVGDYPPKKLEV